MGSLILGVIALCALVIFIRAWRKCTQPGALHDATQHLLYEKDKRPRHG
jgi:hypothetical protein